MDLAVVVFNRGTGAAQAFGASSHPATGAAWAHEVALLEHHHDDRLMLYGTVAGHYVSADERDHVSQRGAMVGGIVGGLLGLPLGPAAVAAGLVAGGAVGAELASPDEVESEPRPLVEDLRAAVPKGSSAIVLIASSQDVDEMLTALGEAASDTRRRTLSSDEMTAIEAALQDTPEASPGPRVEGDAVA